MGGRGSLHHLEIWVGDLPAAEDSWGWLLGRLGYLLTDRWERGQSWTAEDGSYICLEAGPDRSSFHHDRRRAGMNHVAFWAGSRADLDRLVKAADRHGWSLLFADRHPFAGGPGHYAAYLENREGFEVELVAQPEATP
jgi:catechol 2,3-dioxygenase-like lactoylglutathione lyase family enzyme